ncbi:uncharacterized protein LOC118184443 [Stegodyphus dumicola]|uniref:uncharacterized protein LOC118184443 n=1 Tax=Stegodyphus dumicola TaxID=202533 RepID=UPI0015AECF31|nr:uncharacterized protein LOC118184443 [Stegodyphus dumicola]
MIVRVFSKQNLLRTHEHTEHGKSYTPKLTNGGKCYSYKKCPLCDFTSTKADLLKHFENIHDKCIVTEDLQFPSFQEFNVWKKGIEAETKCSFIVERGAQKRNSDTHYFFVCHRSGVYTPEGSGIRHLKLQGSKKINGFCPASITVIETDGKCCVQYLKTHVGHKNEIGHMFLSKEDRMHLASKIAAGIPFERILGEIRDSIAGDQTRMHLVTRHDLHNIEFLFNLSSVRHADDAVSVDSWVREMEGTENSCVLFYKPQGQLSDMYPELNLEDFILIIMNEAQCYMLEKFGKDCVCVMMGLMV